MSFILSSKLQSKRGLSCSLNIHNLLRVCGLWSPGRAGAGGTTREDPVQRGSALLGWAFTYLLRAGEKSSEFYSFCFFPVIFEVFLFQLPENMLMPFLNIDNIRLTTCKRSARNEITGLPVV